MPTTPHYAWITPTIGGDENTWGDEINQAFEDVDADLYAVSLAQAADAAAIVALDTRIDALEGTTPTGWANWRSGIWYRPSVCEGLNTELIVMTAGRRYLVPFNYNGTFDGFGYRHSGPQHDYSVYIIDTDADGSPGSVLWQGAKTSLVGTRDEVVTISPQVELSRPCWLGISALSAGQIYARGNSTTGTPIPPSHWTLGTSAFSPVVADVTYVVYGNSPPYTPTTLGGSGALFGPDIALRTA